MFNFTKDTRMVAPQNPPMSGARPAGLLSLPMQGSMGHAVQGGLLGLPGQPDGMNPQFQQQPQQAAPSGGGGGDFVNQFMGQRNRSWVPMGGGGGFMGGGQGQGGGFNMEQALQFAKLLGIG